MHPKSLPSKKKRYQTTYYEKLQNINLIQMINDVENHIVVLKKN